MLPYRDSRLTQIVLGLFFVVLLGYAYFEAQGLLFGPSISIPAAPTQVYEPYVVLSGHADRISSLLMNGKSVEVTENGSFSEPYLLSPGYNRIVFDAKDKYGRTRSRTLQIVYVAPEALQNEATSSLPTSTPPTSTSTMSTSTAGTVPTGR